MTLLLSILVALASTSLVVTSLFGGFSSVKVNDEGVNEAKGLVEQKTAVNGVDMKLKSAKLQIIAGRKYLLTFDMTRDNVVKECNIEVVFLISPPEELVKTEREDPCYSLIGEHTSVNVQVVKRSTAHLLGGREDIDLGDADVQEAAKWAVKHINRQSNSLYMQALQKIAEGNRQVVNGYIYRFLLYTVSTTCRNNAQNRDKTLDECPQDMNSMQQQCDVTVLKSNMEYSLPNFKCKPLKPSQKNKTPLLGQDQHDYIPHLKSLRGMMNAAGRKAEEKLQNFGKGILGGDTHDYKQHGVKSNILGGDTHDYKQHGVKSNILGGDTHDYKQHGVKSNILGGDTHDYKQHGVKSNILGGDTHDYKQHGVKSNILGGDTHDYKQHGVKSNILGGDTHDYQIHKADPCQEHRSAFEKFKEQHQRIYASLLEESEKFQVFCGNMERIREYQKMERGSAMYGATKFADISEKEFKEKYLGFKVNRRNGGGWPSAEIPKGPIPDAWDWRDHGAVTPVKNQGSCGSCWAFSTTGNIEGRNAIKNKKLVSLSEQELVDCDKIDQGCNGGLPTQAYEAIMELGGLEPEKDYSYEGSREKCEFNKSDVAVKVKGALNISKDEGEMAAWLFKNGPISIGINAFAMQFYMGGIAHPWRIFCNPSHLDHGVLIVGYGKQGSEPFWIVKNSWGPNWGRQGYYYVYRGDGVCGLNTMCTSAIVG